MSYWSAKLSGDRNEKFLSVFHKITPPSYVA
ncbi:hypothetical protein EL80_5422 [Escherichia coli]|nr:hypothetical protein EL80_5422 [Escherichia coli]